MASVSIPDWPQHKTKERCMDFNLNEWKGGAVKFHSRNHVQSTSMGKRYGVEKKPKRLPLSKQPALYESLLTMAIRSSPVQAATVAEIHAYIANSCPYFKAYPGSLKANIIRTLTASGSFVRLGAPCDNYWSLTNEAKPSGKVADDPRVNVIKSVNASTSSGSLHEERYSQSTMRTVNNTPCSNLVSKTAKLMPGKEKLKAKLAIKYKRMAGRPGMGLQQNGYSFDRAFSQRMISGCNPAPRLQHGAFYNSSSPHSLDRHPSIDHSKANSTQPAIGHDDLIKRYIHSNPLYPRVPVITPAGQNQTEETGIKIGEVFSLNPQSSSVMSRRNLPYPSATELSQSRFDFIPYHPCTIRASYAVHNSPTATSFISEDKQCYEDA